jgi:hypothetical protein
MPAFVSSALFGPARCPRPTALLVCAALAVAPFIEIGLIGAHSKERSSSTPVVQLATPDVLPANLGAGTLMLPEGWPRAPVTQGAATDEASVYMSPRYRGGAITLDDVFPFYR